MRNLKKFLALVLAMVMAFSLMLSASAIDYDKYTDKDAVTEEFEEAVAVLSGLKIMEGDGPEDAKTFRPADTITRAEAAAVMYRIATGDVNNDQVNLYDDYSKFVDVSAGDWFAGYVSYCEDAGIIKGTSPTTFSPYLEVTGYEMLAMLLRAIGYGKNNEFTGNSWQTTALSTAESLHITDNVKAANFSSTLNRAARRDVVADLAFESIAFVPTVTYTPALSYNDKTTIGGTTPNPTLGQKIFDLNYSRWYLDVGDWGEPGYYWFKDTVYNYAIPSGANKNIVATILPDPTKTYVDTVRECDVAEDLGIKTSDDFDLIVNQNWLTDPDEGKDLYQIVATDTVTKVGGQGRETKIWHDVVRRWDKAPLGDTVVMIDTYLAKVTRVEEVVLDRNEHVVTPARMYVEMYDEAQRAATPTLARPHQVTISKPSTSKDNWTYAVGDYILVNAKTDPTTGTMADNTTSLDHTTNQTQAEKAAFETNKTLSALIEGDTANVVGKSEPVIGKQTVTYWNAGKHTVEGKDYNDQLCLFLDKAGTTTNTTFAWYLDQRGNLIGIGDQPTTTYGVITKLWASLGQGDSTTDGSSKTYAEVKYADGSTATVVIDKFLVFGEVANNKGHYQANAAAKQMLETANSTELTPVYDFNGGSKTMSSDAGGTATRTQYIGKLYVAPVADVNRDAESTLKVTADHNDGYFGIIKQNLFKFVASANETVIAIEVAGASDKSPVAGDLYAYNFNDKAATASPKLYKNLGYIQTTYTNVRMDNDTKIMVWNGIKTAGITTYDGLSALPGDIDLAVDSEVDWADPDDDGVAEYVFVKGTNAGIVTHNLIYFNGAIHSSRWNDPENKGTMTVVKDGKETVEVTFDNKNEFLTVQNSANYGAHLFAVEMTDGVVTNLMGVTGAGTNYERNIVNGVTGVTLDTGVYESNANVSATQGVTSVSTTLTFDVGPTKGNEYTANTKLAYFRDDCGVDSTNPALPTALWDRNVSGFDSAITYNLAGTATTYYLTGATKVVGDRLDDLNSNRICDVTVVYELVGTQKIATAVYITTDPDVTPNPDVVGDTLRLVSMQVTGGNLRLNVTCSSTETTNTGTTGAVVTLKNTTTGATVLKDQPVAGTRINFTNAPGNYGIIVDGAGGILENTAGQVYEGTITLTLNGVTYTCTFANRGIL